MDVLSNVSGEVPRRMFKDKFSFSRVDNFSFTKFEEIWPLPLSLDTNLCVLNSEGMSRVIFTFFFIVFGQKMNKIIVNVPTFFPEMAQIGQIVHRRKSNGPKCALFAHFMGHWQKSHFHMWNGGPKCHFRTFEGKDKPPINFGLYNAH